MPPVSELKQPEKRYMIMRTLILFIAIISIPVFAFAQKTGQARMEKATFGAGCFWCVEAVFERQNGVQSVMAGYAGGHTVDPSYDDVCTGTTGHAEVTQITFDPAKISYAKLLEVLWDAHDPTTLNRQGADAGTQYRSVIFTHSPEQRATAEASRAAAQKQFDNPIVTEIRDLDKFYPAENYHQDYFRRNPEAPYCRLVIKPKLKKLHLD